jgi:glycosyltransferase involved in cell wall biosynthesis
VKLVHLTTSGELGGAETSLVTLLESIREAEPNWELSVVTPADGPLVERLRTTRIAVDILPFPKRLAAFGEHNTNSAMVSAGAAAAAGAYAFRLAAALRRGNADIVHAHGFKMHVLAALAPPRRSALVWHVHGYLSGRGWTARALRALAPRAAAVLANSASVARDVQHVLGARTLVRTMYNGVDLVEFSPAGDGMDLDAAAGMASPPPGTVRAGLVGTFARWKGHGVFLDALSRLSPLVPVRGYIIGAPIYETAGSQVTTDELRQAARDRGVSDRVAFTGYIPSVARAMRSLDIVVHASTEREPFGMVIAEAMACGRAVVASRAGGAAELFDDGMDAFGHEPGDAGALARAIEILAADPVRRASAGRAARRTAEARFDRRRVAEHLVPLYRTLAAAA